MSTAISQTPSDPATRNLATIQRMGDGFNAGDIDAIMACFVDDAVYEDFRGPAPSGTRHRGRQAIRAIFTQMLAGLPSPCFADHRAVVDAERGALEYTLVLPGDPETRVQLCDFFEFDGGLVTRKSTWIKLAPEVLATAS